MADNDKNNTSGDSFVPKSTQGLEGSVSLEDLKKYHLIKGDDNTTPINDTVSDDQTSNDVSESEASADNLNTQAPQSEDHLQSEESNNHLSEAKQSGESESENSDVKDTNFVATPPITPVQPDQDIKHDEESVKDDTSSATEESQSKAEDVKPWEKSFDSDTDDEGHVSRKVSKEKQRGNHTLVVTLVIALIVIMFTPVVINAVKGSGSGDLDSSQSAKSVENKDKSTKRKKSAAKKSAKKSTAKKSTTAKTTTKAKKTDSSNSNASANTNNSDTNSNTAASDNNASNSTNNSQSTASNNTQQTDQQASNGATDNSSNSTDNSSSESYYTVKAGDNWFRIAYNNNLTTAQLKSLNGNVGTLTPGTTLRVK
ncbi:LysM peptidoglycan-binding domain-containing protein [Companilactobacillus nuruki]|uniref:LysM domain-containing protein n=1 Tax=Companilactobacillus nuruki TaxID=1993540 RepID=A0A2N7AU54_9LACO|nr:LysM domain-containing protein [Companilactobacillus nuruki]PMD70319.1 hypothetical protein CBP76_06725 [Companilactobacillus nuruki]